MPPLSPHGAPSAPTRLLVVSDIHGCVSDLRWILRHEPADAVFFLGDGLRELDEAIAAEHARDPHAVACPVYRVRGNCDIGAPDPVEALAPFDGVLFYYTHGHLYGVKAGSERLREAAAARGADVVLYGHTHRQDLETTPGGPAVFNPGSVLNGSYGLITVTEGRCAYGWRRLP